MRRINLFLKGNLDVRDSLHSLRLNGVVQWNGINETARVHCPGTTFRLRHETWTRSDALLQSDGRVPDDLAQRQLPLRSYPATSQFSLAVFETKVDAIIFSIQPDVMTNLLRHRRQGYLFLCEHAASLSKEDRDWAMAAFEPIAPIDADSSMNNFSRIIDKCRASSDAPILIYNISSIVPGDWVHCHAGLDEMLSTRIKRFNLGLIELSQSTGISIVDVDDILARHGAERLKIDPVHLNAEGCRLVAEAVVRILGDLGCLENAR